MVPVCHVALAKQDGDAFTRSELRRGVLEFHDFASGRYRVGVILAAAIPADQDQNSVGSRMIAERSVACADAVQARPSRSLISFSPDAWGP